jgi:penicillin amidase
VQSIVEVRIDGSGVPHIDARSEADLWFSMGYVHARERFFQMDLLRRAAGGRLAKILGEYAVERDRWMRTLGVQTTARAQLAKLSQSELEIVEAYAAGVNEALERYGSWIAPESWLLGIEPTSWQVTDTLAVGVLFHLSMSDAGARELTRAAEYAALGRERAGDLWGWDQDQIREWIPGGRTEIGSARDRIRHFPTPVQADVWAVAGRKTEGDGPLLASTVSLPPTLPVRAFAVHLHCPGLHVAGVSLPGVPGVLIGHTEEVAWGISPVRLDDQDVYYLTVDETRARERIDGAWHSLRTVTESINVREADEPELLKVRVSKLGPVIADDGRTVLALSWSGHSGPSPIEALLRMSRAKSVTDVAAAWRDAIGPSLHLVAVDRNGHLMHQIVGRVPIRERGAGRLPSPGEDSRWSWQGFLPFVANPRTLDPSSGWLAVASHDLFLEADYRADMGFPAEFESPWRVRRIRELLTREDRWDVNKALQLQLDVVSGRALAVLQLLGPELATQSGQTAKTLRTWNGSMRAGEVAPAAYLALLETLAVAVGADEARAVSLDFNPIDHARLVRLLAGGMDESWWDDTSTTPIETRDLVVQRSLAQLERASIGLVRTDHQVTLRHPFENLPGIGMLMARAFSRGPFPVGGDETTIAAFIGATSSSTEVTMAPLVRFVARPGAWDETVLVIAGGQSGRPWSPHYDSQLRPWLAGRPVRMAFSGDGVEEATVARLRLEPR